MSSRFLEFCNMPIAELERFGLPTKIVSLLEVEFGLFVRDLAGVTRERLIEVKHIGVSRANDIVMALRAAYEEIVNGRCYHQIHISEGKVRRIGKRKGKGRRSSSAVDGRGGKEVFGAFTKATEGVMVQEESGGEGIGGRIGREDGSDTK